VVVYGLLQSPQPGSGAMSRVFGNWVFTPIYRYNSPRPFNLLAGTELNNDRHNTTDRPLFAGRNIGVGPNFWTVDTRLSRRFFFAERRFVEVLMEGFNLFNRLNYTSVNNTVGTVIPQGPLTGRHDRGPSDPLGFTAAADPRRIQLGLRLTF
jgi:hypothetical protein